jgi:hypothetical protein
MSFIYGLKTQRVVRIFDNLLLRKWIPHHSIIWVALLHVPFLPFWVLLSHIEWSLTCWFGNFVFFLSQFIILIPSFLFRYTFTKPHWNYLLLLACWKPFKITYFYNLSSTNHNYSFSFYKRVCVCVLLILALTSLRLSEWVSERKVKEEGILLLYVSGILQWNILRWTC